MFAVTSRSALWRASVDALATVLVLCGCPPRIDTGDDGGTGPIYAGPEGGLFIRAGYAISIPRGALAKDTVITAAIVDSEVPEVPQRTRISLGYRFSPATLSFSVPATVYLPWIAERVPPGVDPNTYDMRRQSGEEAALPLPGAKTNTAPFTAVEAQTDRLGLFWVTSPSEPNVSRLEITPSEATTRIGETQPFSARVIDPTGQSIQVPVTWTVVPARVATITADGLATATGPGMATISARVGNTSATAALRVRGSAVGPITFTHQNPFPTGNDLYGGAVAPGGLGTIFVGANSTVLARSFADDWSRLFSAPAMVLKAVGGTTADNAVAVGKSNNAGVLVQLRGEGQPPLVTVYEPRSISDLGALWFDGSHGMAVGEGNDLLIFRAGRWQKEAHPSFERLMAVVGDGAGSFVVLGHLGSLYRWDPTRGVWDSLYQTRLSVLLTAGAIADSSGAEAWAVSSSALWHFSAGRWEALSFPVSPAVTNTTALGLFDRRVVIGARDGRVGRVLVYGPLTAADGGVSPSWSSFELRGPQVARGAFGAGPLAPIGYVVGDVGAVWEWRSESADFVERSRGFYGDVVDLALTGGEVFAVVNECTTPACASREGAVMALGAQGFARLGTQTFNSPLYAIAARSPTDVLVSAEHAVWRWDGTAWSPFPVQGQTGPILDLRACGPTWYAGGRGGAWYRGTTSLTHLGQLSPMGDVTAVHCPSETEVWMVTDDGLLASRAGTPAWVAHGTRDVNPAPWFAVWAPGGGEAFAFGDARYGVYWNTSRLSALESLGGIGVDKIFGMWGSSVDNLYAVGVSNFPSAFGCALRFDGIHWQLVDSGSQRAVLAIDGSSATEVWVGTALGGILRGVPPR